MRFSVASEPGDPDVPNEDWAGVTPAVIVVLDGVTVHESMASGCSHGTPWYVQQLGIRLVAAAALHDDMPLPVVLARAIRDVTALHPGCDLAALGAPSAAVGMLRFANGGTAEYLVLADVTVVLKTSSGVTVITDDRVNMRGGVDPAGPRVAARVAEHRRADRNQPGGYWVAAADPRAAEHAVAGSVRLGGLSRAAVVTDGAARAVDLFGVTRWADVLVQADAGQLIRTVRDVERSDSSCAQWPRFKRNDDATAVFWRRP